MERRDFILAAAVAGAARSAEAAAPALKDEPPLEPALPIVDPHHHMWDVPANAPPGRTRYFLPDLLADINDSGHNVTHTVYVEAGSMYRTDGPAELKPVGETEFANGVAAMSASGLYGPCRVNAGIVCNADLRLGDDAGRVLDAHVDAGNGRLRGIRNGFAWADTPIFGRPLDPARKGLFKDAGFRKGLAQLTSRNLSFEAWCFHPQIDEFSDLATAFPNTNIILDHIGSPLLIGPYAGKDNEVMAAWRASIRELAKRPNVAVKVGGLGMDLVAPIGTINPRNGSEELAVRWRPYVETCIEAFGAERCMFESNFPPDEATCSYGALWNAFKRIAAGYSAAEKAALFSATAKRVYRLA